MITVVAVDLIAGALLEIAIDAEVVRVLIARVDVKFDVCVIVVCI